MLIILPLLILLRSGTQQDKRDLRLSQVAIIRVLMELL